MLMLAKSYSRVERIEAIVFFPCHESLLCVLFKPESATTHSRTQVLETKLDIKE